MRIRLPPPARAPFLVAWHTPTCNEHGPGVKGCPDVRRSTTDQSSMPSGCGHFSPARCRTESGTWRNGDHPSIDRYWPAAPGSSRCKAQDEPAARRVDLAMPKIRILVGHSRSSIQRPRNCRSLRLLTERHQVMHERKYGSRGCRRSIPGNAGRSSPTRARCCFRFRQLSWITPADECTPCS